MAEHTFSVHVNLAALTSQLQRALQRSIDLTSFGLMAAARAPREDALKLPGAWFQLATAGNEALDFESAGAEFQKWAVACGLRDSIEAMRVFLEEARNIVAVWSLTGRPTIMGEEWNAKMVREAREFHKMGLPGKIEFLKKNYDPVLLPDSADEVLSINDARNCLVHRRGIVADRDLNALDGLLVQWRKFELVVRGPGGERVIVPPATIQGGETLSGRQARASRLFRLGEGVSFSPQEFAELCWTLLWFGKALVQNVEAHGKAKGVKFTEPQPATETKGS